MLQQKPFVEACSNEIVVSYKLLVFSKTAQANSLCYNRNLLLKHVQMEMVLIFFVRKKVRKCNILLTWVRPKSRAETEYPRPTMLVNRAIHKVPSRFHRARNGGQSGQQNRSLHSCGYPLPNVPTRLSTDFWQDGTRTFSIPQTRC